MLYLENNTTFSGADIRVFVYKDLNSILNNPHEGETEANIFDMDLTFENLDDFGSNEKDQKITQLLEKTGVTVPNQDRNSPNDPETVDKFLDSGMLKDNELRYNKVNSQYVDIVRAGSDQGAINLAKQYNAAKQQSSLNRNKQVNGEGKNFYKPIIELGSVYSFTYSSFREKNAVRSLGRVSAQGYTRGQRTIAGSMNFTVFQSHELMDFLRPNSNYVLLDQLPKFNMMLVMLNEYGGASIMHLFNVEISSESQQMSVEDLALMDSISFYATDIATLESVGNLFDTSLAMLHPSYIASKSLEFINKDNKKMSLKDIYTMKSGNVKGVQELLRKSRGIF